MHEFRVSSIFNELNQDAIVVKFDHHRNVLIAGLGTCGESSSLVGENCFMDVTYVDMGILFFLTTKLDGLCQKD